MVIYLQAMCAECKRLFAFREETGAAAIVTCTHCGCSAYSTPIQISSIEYLEVVSLYSALESRS